jgi:hypothetical protein
MPTYHFYSVEGNSPLKLEKSVGKPLRDYKIYGACGDLVTDETDANYGKYKIPIVVGGKNLFNEELLFSRPNGVEKTEQGYLIKLYPALYREDLVQYGAALVKHIKSMLKPNVTYTLSRKVDKYIDRVSSSIVFRDAEEKAIITTGIGAGIKSVTFTLTQEEIDRINRVNIYGDVNTPILFEYIQLELGETATEYEPYKEPFTANIYLDEPLSDEEYIDFVGQKLVKVDSEQPISLPKINTFKGLNIVSVDTETQPSNIEIQYYK